MELIARKADGRRMFTPEFKREQVERVVRGEVTISELSAAPLASKTFPTGTARIQWDGRGQAGDRVAPGVYFVRLEAGKVREVRRLVVLE